MTESVQKKDVRMLKSVPESHIFDLGVVLTDISASLNRISPTRDVSDIHVRKL